MRLESEHINHQRAIELNRASAKLFQRIQTKKTA